MSRQKKTISIAIDGPAGAGKSTLSRRVAETLHYFYVDTGAIYRTVSLGIQMRKINLEDPAAVAAALPDMKISLDYHANGLQRMKLDTQDVTEAIRKPEVSRWTSIIAAYPEVRTYLLEMQRELARNHNIVMDGRDIGTIVLPDADIKIFLTASPEARAKRRASELEQRGTPEAFEKILSEIKERDWQDTHRDTAPLRQALDAVILDTTELDFEQSAAALLKIIKERL